MCFIIWCILSVVLNSSIATSFSYSPRMNGGHESKVEQVPFMASLRESRGSQFKHICGAVVISQKHLLTAAQCCYSHHSDWFSIAVGSHIKDDETVVNHSIKRITVHENYDAFVAPFKHDIALIELDQPLKLSERVKVIPLNSTLHDGEIEATASGFGGVYVRFN